VFRSSLIQVGLCRPLIFVLSNPVRADKPLSVFSLNTKPTLLAPEPIRVMRRRDEAPRRRMKGIQLSAITQEGRLSFPGAHAADRAISAVLIRDVPVRTLDFGIVVPCGRASNLLEHFPLSFQKRLAQFSRAESQNA
jgi:hypothetical protein